MAKSASCLLYLSFEYIVSIKWIGRDRIGLVLGGINMWETSGYSVRYLFSLCQRWASTEWSPS